MDGRGRVHALRLVEGVDLEERELPVAGSHFAQCIKNES
jgi:hypothetical protein